LGIGRIAFSGKWRRTSRDLSGGCPGRPDRRDAFTG